ncbi:diacylglycerol kinase family lipid kinase [Rhodospirillaceae bacterium KN72]|uniref:Diacylglycerol kinase family lipid kinase n=1 Tax=Pacificispira spongiicola TaxID=2729598 RepID=A0A7Y0E1G6_9PROT|nr:diacylglycerol kinase family protein [Pacificispira spongiicola]NMM45408.1 diacylglycerol kinase family lipid kinase [Pacificispira spongiicola]
MVRNRRIAVIYNPVAGFRQRGRLKRFLKHLRRLGHEVLLRRTEGPGDATLIARDLDADTVDAVVAAGGDGTINEVANGLIGRGIPLAIAPLGTANVLAFEIGLGLNLRRAADLPAQGVAVEIRPALADDRGFLLMVSAGPDARVVASVNSRLKRVIGKTAYVVAALREIARGRWQPIRVVVDGTPYEAGLVVVTHASHYAGPFVIAPETRLGDDSVTVVLLEGRKRRALLRYGLALLTSRVAGLRDATVLQAQSVRIDGPAGEPIQSDGDLIGAAPIDITLGTKTLHLLVPDAGRVIRPVSA